VILLGRGTKKRQQKDIAAAQRDPAFRQALLREAVECILNGDLETGKAVLRDYVNATLGFQDLEKRTGIPAKSLMRMPDPKGSPSAANLTNILTALQKTEGVRFELALRR
jgi:DNA-binding phage protein